MDFKSRSSGSKSDSKSAMAGKIEKPTAPEKKEKENAFKEQPVPTGKKPHAASELTPTESHNPPKPTPSRAESREPAGPAPEMDSKGTEEEEGTGSFYENMKPMLLIGGVVIAALAVIMGVAFLARKK